MSKDESRPRASSWSSIHQATSSRVVTPGVITSLENARSAISRLISPSLGEGGDFGGGARGPEVGHEALRRDQAVRVGSAEHVAQVEVGGVGKAVGAADRGRHVDPDPLRIALGHVLRERFRAAEVVVDAALLQLVAADSERGPFGALAPVGEDVVRQSPT